MRYWLMFWALGFIWGSSFLLIKVAVESVGVLPLVSIRLLIASSLMFLYLTIARLPLPKRRDDWLGILFVGFFNVAVPFSLITRAEESIDSSLASVLNATVPLFSLIIAHFALQEVREKLNTNKILGLLIGYVGIIVLASRGLSEATNNPIDAQIIMLGGSISYAIAVVFMRARLKHLPPLSIAGLSLIVGMLFMVPLTLISAPMPDWSAVPTKAWVALLTLGSVNTVIAYFLFYTLLDAWGAKATVVTYTFPPIGIALGAIFLGEPVDSRLIIGAALILIGILAVNYRGSIRQSRAISAIGK